MRTNPQHKPQPPTATQYKAPETVSNGRLFYCLYTDADRGQDPRPLNYLLLRLYILYLRCYIYCVYRYILITYVILEYTAAPAQNTGHQERPRTQSPKPEPDARTRPRSPAQAPYIAPHSLYASAPKPSNTRDGALHSRSAPPHPFIYKYLRYILYILKIYNICVYIMCIYLSIGIYRISAAKKRANRTQKEYTHSQSKAQSNTTKKNTSNRSKDTATPNTTRR